MNSLCRDYVACVKYYFVNQLQQGENGSVLLEFTKLAISYEFETLVWYIGDGS